MRLPLMKNFSILFLLSAVACAFPSATNSGPVVKLSYGSFQGNTTGHVNEFLGMPFAAPPVGNLRFAPPRPPAQFTGVRQATSFGAACFQQSSSITSVNASVLETIVPELALLAAATEPAAEECLFINVIAPTNIPQGQKLPVLFWIYGGGFSNGDI